MTTQLGLGSLWTRRKYCDGKSWTYGVRRNYALLTLARKRRELSMNLIPLSTTSLSPYYRGPIRKIPWSDELSLLEERKRSSG
jgi:hypothetical protein